MVIRSKVSFLYWVLAALFCAVPAVGGIIFFTTGDKMMLFVLVVGALDIIMLLPALFLTRYTLTEKELQVRCAFLYRQDIPYKCIRRISDARDISLAPALSHDRVEIAFRLAGIDGRVFLSPKDKGRFVKELCGRTGLSFESLADAYDRKQKEALAQKKEQDGKN